MSALLVFAIGFATGMACALLLARWRVQVWLRNGSIIHTEQQEKS